MKKLTIISDLHNEYENLIINKSDFLICCGDSLNRGLLNELQKFQNGLVKEMLHINC
jgi:predicted phosphodiesterase